MNHTRSTRAFTVLEMLLAAGITALLAGVMLAVVINTLNGWSRTQGALSTESQARLVLDQLALDLESALNRPDGGTWLALTVQNDNGASGQWVAAAANAKPTTTDSLDPLAARLNPPGQIVDARFGTAGVWLRLVAATPTTSASANEPNAPAAVAYQIVRSRVTTSTDAEAHYVLFRSEVKPSVTFAGGYDLASASLPYASSLRTPTLSQALADHVIDFGLWLYQRQGNGTLQRIFPTDNSAGTVGFPSSAGVFPDVADVMIRVLTPEGARKIQALETNAAGGVWWAIAEQNSKVFTRRITLHPRSF